jgi:hypothetical protein
MAASNAMALKSDRKLLKLAMKDFEGLSCQENDDCVSCCAFTVHDFEGVKGDCRPERLCHLLVSWIRSCTYV